ncbi:MAG: nickel ABC transporter permease [Ruminococcus sp.]
MKRKQLLKRLLQIVIVLFGISFLTFGLMYMAPGDPVQAMYAASGSIPSEEIMDQTREALGLNEPFLVQYANWLLNCLHGDFGTSYSYSRPVTELMLQRLWPTLQLALSSLVIMLVVAVPLGILSAVHKGGIADYIVRGYTFLGVSMPNFWVGLILLYVFAVKLELLPVVSSGQGFSRMILPAVTLAFAMAAKYTRQVRTAFLEELNQDYVIGARCRGIKESVILWRHVLPNSILPLITLLGLSLGSLLGGTAVVEVIFSYPGLGNLAVDAITSMDYSLIQGYVLWIALIYMVLNLLVDVSYNRLDPRIKEEGGKAEI